MQVRIYQLKTDARLRTASFEDVWQSDKTALAEDLIQVDQQTLYPGEYKLYPVKPAQGMQYLAVVALFREPQGRDWFASYQIEPPRTRPPCSDKDSRIPVWVDRMQVQDGAGREAGTPSESAPPSTDSSGPTLPGSLPSVPTLPSTPQTPQAPSLPGAPTLPSTPQAPTLPSTPTLPR